MSRIEEIRERLKAFNEAKDTNNDDDLGMVIKFIFNASYDIEYLLSQLQQAEGEIKAAMGDRDRNFEMWKDANNKLSQLQRRFDEGVEVEKRLDGGPVWYLPNNIKPGKYILIPAEGGE